VQPSEAAAHKPHQAHDLLRCGSIRPLRRHSTSATSSGPEWSKSVRTTGSCA